MKKIVLGLAFLGLTGIAQAQEAADRKVQAGLIVGVGMNFQKMGTKKLASNGAGSDLTIGVNLNYTFNETVGINTGIEFDFSTLKYASVDPLNPVYYYYNDNTILTKDGAADAEGAFLMNSRKQKPIYLTIPLMALFRTKFIGYFRYFVKFGLRSSFLLSNSVTDEGSVYLKDNNGVFLNDPFANPLSVGTTATNTNMTPDKNDMDFFKSSVGLAGGAEWNFTGTTSLVAELGYYYGFTDIYWDRKDKDSSLATSNAAQGNTPSFFNNAAKQSQLMFKVSILF